MGKTVQESKPPGSEAERQPLAEAEGNSFLKKVLETRFPAVAILGMRVRELVRSQLRTATEEITLRAGELFLGYSVHSFTSDPLVSLTISSESVVLVFIHGLPIEGDIPLLADHDGTSATLPITVSALEDAMALKVALRATASASRPKLPVGRTGHSFLMGAKSAT